MGMKWFTRLNDGFSKKIENHEHALASIDVLQFRPVLQTIARDAIDGSRISNHVWTLE